MKDMKAERDRQIAELWLACYTEEEIAEKVGVSQPSIHATVAELSESDIWQKNLIFAQEVQPDVG